MRLQVSHKTRYSFEIAPAYGLEQLRLSPKSNPGQIVLDWTIDIEGGAKQAEFQDEHSNITMLVALDPDKKELIVHSHGRVDMTDCGGIIGEHIGFAPLWLYKQVTELTETGPLVENLSKSVLGATDVTSFHALSSAISGRVKYMTGATVATTTAEEAVSLGQGVCQDHAHIFIAAARYAGHPARYVSGYLMMNDRIYQDATHAWAEVWIDGLGWTGFDISNGISPDRRYVRLATGLDYKQAAPISGLMIGGSGESMNVDVRVQQQ